MKGYEVESAGQQDLREWWGGREGSVQDKERWRRKTKQITEAKKRGSKGPRTVGVKRRDGEGRTKNGGM